MGGCVSNCMMHDYISEYITAAARINFTAQRAADHIYIQAEPSGKRERRVCDFDTAERRLPHKRQSEFLGHF